MSWSLTKIVGLVIIPLMVASAILASLNSINTETIKPTGKEANQKVKTYGRQVTIGKNVNEQWMANEQMKEVIILNQISAWNCAMIPGILTADQNSPEDPSNWDNNDNKFDYQIYHRDNDKRLFRWLWKSGSVPGCTGASQVKLPSINVDLPSLGDLAKLATFWDEAISSLEGIRGFLDCQVVKTMEKQNGHDMEGVYGRIGFETKMNTKLATSDNDRLWAMSIMAQDGCTWQEEEREVQRLWKGNDISEFHPFPHVNTMNIKTRKKEGLEKIMNLYSGSQSPIGSQGNSIDNENTDPGGLFRQVGEPGKRLAGEVIVDAPLILPQGPDSSASGIPWKVRKGYYLFCNGVEGHVQTNTIRPGFEQESTRKSTKTLLNIPVESYTGAGSITYTYVHITSDNRKSCFDELGISENPQYIDMGNGVQIKYYETAD